MLCKLWKLDCYRCSHMAGCFLWQLMRGKGKKAIAKINSLFKMEYSVSNVVLLFLVLQNKLFLVLQNKPGHFARFPCMPSIRLLFHAAGSKGIKSFNLFRSCLLQIEWKLWFELYVFIYHKACIFFSREMLLIGMKPLPLIVTWVSSIFPVCFSILRRKKKLLHSMYVLSEKCQWTYWPVKRVIRLVV